MQRHSGGNFRFIDEMSAAVDEQLWEWNVSFQCGNKAFDRLGEQGILCAFPDDFVGVLSQNGERFGLLRGL